jgi:hypothetical protein
MAVIHSVSNAYMNELLKYLSAFLLPPGNRLPRSHNKAKNMVKKLGLNYNIIPCCLNGCVLFRKALEHVGLCPECGASKFIPGSNCIPARVIRHFPLIPRLLRMYRSTAISKLLRFHTDFPNADRDVMKSLADSPAWEFVNTHVDPSFALETRNLRFGFALDGVNPFKHNNTQHSTWPVLMLIYNLPPFLVTKKFFIQLSILISGKDAPLNQNIDVFIRPLVEELQLLWKGIPTQDFSRLPDERHFQLRGILMWNILDYPGYGLISGLYTHGYKGCVVCGPATDSRAAKSGNKLDGDQNVWGSKIVFGGSRRWTRRSHPYKRSLHFNRKVDFRAAPVRMTTEEIIRCAEAKKAYLASSQWCQGEYEP